MIIKFSASQENQEFEEIDLRKATGIRKCLRFMHKCMFIALYSTSNDFECIFIV